MSSTSDLKDLLLAAKDLIAVIVPFASIWITQKFLASREEDRYSKDFKQRKVDEFYGPMLSMILELVGRRAAYNEIMAGVEAQNKDASVIVEDENSACRREVFTSQAEAKLEDADRELVLAMQKLYREKLWLAEASTVDLFQSFIALTEISSLNSNEFASWKSLDDYAHKNHLFEQIEADLRKHKESLLNELDLN